MIRLAWHDSGAFCKKGNVGGANASIRFEKEQKHGGNAGLHIALKLLEPVREKYSEDSISNADLYQMASVVAIEVMDGPVIPMR